MKTLPCGHCVVCRKCFVKTIQTAVTDRCLPLRCVVCRTKILKLKQQPQTSAAGGKSRPHTAVRTGHQHHQTTGIGLQGRHLDPGTSQRPRPAVNGQASKGLFSGLGPSHARVPALTGSAGTSRLPRPMHPLLIYPSEASVERSRPGSGAGATIGWSEDSMVGQGSGVATRGSPLTIVASSSRRRIRHCTPSTAAAVHVSG